MFSRIPLLVLILFLTACSDSDNNNLEGNSYDNPYEGYSSALYSGTENWLCRPDIEGEANVCEADLSSTIIFPDGTTQFEASPTAVDQPVDCFYVYPTVSRDLGDNARFASGC